MHINAPGLHASMLTPRTPAMPSGKTPQTRLACMQCCFMQVLHLPPTVLVVQPRGQDSVREQLRGTHWRPKGRPGIRPGPAVVHLVVVDGAVGGGVLQQHAGGVLVEGEAALIAHQHLQPQAVRAALAHGNRLRVALVLPACMRSNVSSRCVPESCPPICSDTQSGSLSVLVWRTPW